MIPNNITKGDIITAINEIENNNYQIPPNRDSTLYLLEYNGKKYPPKYVVSLANKFVNSKELDPSSFNGGTETNNFLKKLGFIITEKSPYNDTPSNNYNLTRVYPNVWWVNQGDSYERGKEGGYIWAPLKKKDGQGTVYHWEMLIELKKDDIVLNYANGCIRSVSKVIEPAINSPRPSPSQDEKWAEEGRLVKLEYFTLNPPIELEKFNTDILNLDISQGPINSAKRVNQGYLFRFLWEGLVKIQNCQPETEWPEFTKNGPIIPDNKIKIAKTYSIDNFIHDTGFDKDIIESWQRRLLRKKHIVFQGPPGTGKTFVAQHLAKLMVSDTEGFWDLVQFHPSYAYEDFMQGIRPSLTDRGQISYDLKDGRFVEFCQKAEKLPNSPCILIIDEINRANLSRVFGELMYLLEYRNSEIPLSSGTNFKIPENVFIIGTMNTADRSIAVVDHALRRRFSFIRLNPEYNVLKKYLILKGYPGESLVKVLSEVNTVISDPNYEVGISYFMKKDDDLRVSLPEIWVSEIESYLEEYFYDKPSKVDSFRWEALCKSKLSDWRPVEKSGN